MKKDYRKPEVELVKFISNDIITDSDPHQEGEGEF